MRELILAVAVLLATAPVRADQFDFARFSLLRGAAADTYELQARIPTAVPGEGEVGLPPQCEEQSRDVRANGSGTSILLKFRCNGALRPGDQLIVPWGEDGSVLSSSLSGARAPVMLHGRAGRVALPLDIGRTSPRPLGAIAAEYTRLGAIHILEGFDHLAFVLCLCLLTRGTLLLLLVTAFTVGHSISLALATLGIVAVPMPPVEATIALSIAFMAREALLHRDAGAEALQRRRYMAVVAAFGLLHGLGFASVLHELGTAAGEQLAGLVFFNVGVEIGQLVFVFFVLAMLRVLRLAAVEAPLRTGLLYTVGSVGAFWTLQRLAAFGWA